MDQERNADSVRVRIVPIDKDQGYMHRLAMAVLARLALFESDPVMVVKILKIALKQLTREAI